MASLQSLKYLVVKPKNAHTSTVIFLHGLGDTGAGWEPVAVALSKRFPNTKWILPHARLIPVSINMQMKMSAWFDLTGLDEHVEEDEKGMLSSAHAINELITTEVDSGIPADKIVLGGFSQGCTMAILTGLTTERKLAGIVGLSGWLPLRKRVKSMISDHATNLPIFWAHGRHDQTVPYRWGELSVNVLRDDLKVKNLTFKSYDIGHEADSEEISDLGDWLSNVLPKE